MQRDITTEDLDVQELGEYLKALAGTGAAAQPLVALLDQLIERIQFVGPQYDPGVSDLDCCEGVARTVRAVRHALGLPRDETARSLVKVHQLAGGGTVKYQLGPLPDLPSVLPVLRELRERLERQADAGRAPSSDTGAKTSRLKKKAGRKPDRKIAERNKKMFEAWEAGKYQTYKEIGRKFEVSEDVARHAITNISRRRNK